MPTFTIHEPPNATSDRVDRADALEFVRDGFSWPTAIFPPLGFLQSRLWLAAAAYLVAVTLGCWLLSSIGVNAATITLLVLALHILCGFELSSVRRWSLARDGYTTVGTVTGKTRDECERRFFETWLPAQPVIRATSTT